MNKTSRYHDIIYIMNKNHDVIIRYDIIYQKYSSIIVCK